MVTDDLLDIGDVAAATGLAPSALRFYERRGLVEPAARNGLRRQYRPEVVDRLALVLAARDAGFTIRQIGELLDAADEPALRGALAAKAAELDARIERLTAMRERLRHAVTCDSPRLLECPHVRADLRARTSPTPGRTARTTRP